MNLEKLLRDIGKVGAKMLLNKQEKTSEKINLSQLSSTDILPIILKRLVHEGDYNKAENLLHKELQRNNSEQMYEIAVNFYDLLLEKQDEELEKRNFTREEIYQGLEDIKSYRDKN